MSMSMSRKSRLAIVAAITGATALVAAGCGEVQGDAAAGKQKFAACGGCHTLADAGTKGSSSPTGGPNLDDTFRQSRHAGVPESQMAGVVNRWIQIAQPPMPRHLVTGQDAKDVAVYVASVAGKEKESPARAALPPVPEVVPRTFLH